MELSNPQHEAFAQHVVSGLSLTQAAVQAGYKPSAANNMGSRVAKLSDVRMRIAELRDMHTRTATVAAGIRNPQSRVTALESRWEKMRQIITERALDPEMQSVPGGKTGLVVMTFKQLGSGATAAVVREYRVDTQLLAELRAHEQQAAEELGQWTKRTETYKESVSLNLMDGKQLRDALQQHLGQAPANERKALLDMAPELAEIVVASTPQSTSDNSQYVNQSSD